MSYYCPNCFSTLDGSYRCPKCTYVYKEVNPLFLRFNTILQDRYLIGREIGKGGFGITYLAYDLQAKELRCVKEFFPDSVASRNSNQSNELFIASKHLQKYRRMLESFYKEASQLYTHSSCEDVVTLYNYFYENKTAYITMEYIEGTDLRKHIEKNDISPAQAVDITRQIAKALQPLHENLLIHRDIRPANILFTNEGKIKLIDFGAARYFSEGEVKEFSVILAPNFAPPEQFYRDGNQGPWTDVYALGATFYKLITGSSPPGVADRYIDNQYLKLGMPSNALNNSIEKLINRMMSLEIETRIQKMSEVVDELNNIIGHLGNVGIEIKPVLLMYRVVVFEGNEQKQFYFREDEIINIGRRECAVKLENRYVSRTHCYVEFYKKERVFRIANNSPNGIYDVQGVKHEIIDIKERGYFYILYPSISAYIEILEGG